MQRSTIKNRATAEMQISAEQLVNEARAQFGDLNDKKSQREREQALLLSADKDELKDYLQVTRKKYEDHIRKDRLRLRSYTEYARFESQQLDYRRMRSIMERAVSVLSSTPQLWLQYAELEAKAGFTNHALNVMHRAVGLLPRVDALWLKYLFFEQALGDEARTRAVFERWMTWEPKEEAWFAFMAFEERVGHQDRARDVFERYCGTHPTARAYCKYAKWEDQGGRPDLARQVFERAAGARVGEDGEPLPDELGDEERSKPDLWLAFGQFESRHEETDRARALYLHALQVVQEGARGRIFAALAAFEKKLGGDGAGVDNVVTERRRQEYEAAVAKDPFDYDSWFDLARLEEASGTVERVRDVYARAGSHPPPPAAQKEKRLWRRFVYIFVYLALFEELRMKDVDRARAALKRGLGCVPHKDFTFGKLWILGAHLELRAGDLAAARKLMGAAIGVHPKDKTFRAYLQMELQLGQVDRCRILYEKYLQFNPANASTWSKYAEMEAAVGELGRARAVFELGVGQATLDEPDKLWLRYIDFESSTEDNAERVRALYERLVQRTGGHVKVWVAYCKHVAFAEALGLDLARKIAVRADGVLKARLVQPTVAAVGAGGAAAAAGDEDLAFFRRAMVELEEQALEQQLPGASAETVDKARALLPQRVERRRAVPGATPEEETTFVDVLELVFPDAEGEAKASDADTRKRVAALKMLEVAQRLKKQKQEQQEQ